MFSTLLESFLPFSSNLKLSSANPFSLEESKICRSERVKPATACLPSPVPYWLSYISSVHSTISKENIFKKKLSKYKLTNFSDISADWFVPKANIWDWSWTGMGGGISMSGAGSSDSSFSRLCFLEKVVTSWAMTSSSKLPSGFSCGIDKNNCEYIIPSSSNFVFLQRNCWVFCLLLQFYWDIAYEDRLHHVLLFLQFFQKPTFSSSWKHTIAW